MCKCKTCSCRVFVTKIKEMALSEPNHCSCAHNLRGKMFSDALGRDRIRWLRSGALNVCLHASIFHSSTSATHVNLKEILQPIVLGKNKKVVTMICDGDPDWTPKSTPNIVDFGRLWRDLNLDILILTSYAPGHSLLNHIQCTWAPNQVKYTVDTMTPL